MLTTPDKTINCVLEKTVIDPDTKKAVI